MFAGHYSAALALKAVQPRVPVWTLLLGAQFVDILWGLLVLADVEHFRLVPTLPSNPLALEHMPYTHSLVATVFWSAVAFAVARRALNLPGAGAAAVAAVVASHWFLDLLVHRPDLPLVFGPPKLGLSLWNHPLPAYLLEVVLIVASAWLCVRALGVGGRSLRMWLGFAAGLLLLQTATSFGPLPTSVTSIVLSSLGLYLVIPWIGNRVERTGSRAGGMTESCGSWSP